MLPGFMRSETPGRRCGGYSRSKLTHLCAVQAVIRHRPLSPSSEDAYDELSQYLSRCISDSSKPEPLPHSPVYAQ